MPIPSVAIAIIAIVCQSPRLGDTPLKPGTLLDPDMVPFVLRFPVRESLSEMLVGPGHVVQVRGRELHVDTQGNGKPNITISKAAETIVVKKGPIEVSLLFYRQDETWIAAPATTASGTIGKRTIEFLDANCDGDCFSTNDWVRFDEGVFQRCSKERALATKDMFLSYSIVPGKSSVATWQPQTKPAWANDLQWSGLLATNVLRNQYGLSPLALDEQGCHGCQLHAEYLYLNNYDYSKPWDGVGSHEELPGLPGFTEEGRSASHLHATSGDADPASTAHVLFSAMLHRTTLIGNAGLSVGSIDKSQNASAHGYTVMGGQSLVVTRFEDVVVVPGPGSKHVPREIQDERPAPERIPNFYTRARGYPISVTLGTLPAANFGMDLFEGKKRARLSGVLFSPTEPIHSSRPQNSSSVFFVPDNMLRSDEVYEARFRCTVSGEPRELIWRFHSDK